MRERSATRLVRASVFVWSLVFGLSVLLPVTADRTGAGFTRGVNRVEIFFTWQLVAVGVAVVAAVTARLARRKIAKPVRGLGYLPLAVHVVIGILLLLVALGAVLTR